MGHNTPLAASHDPLGDVLYLTLRHLGVQEPTRNHEEADGLVLRRQADTGEPMGATLVDFQGHWLAQWDTVVPRLAHFLGVPSATVEQALRATGAVPDACGTPNQG